TNLLATLLSSDAALFGGLHRLAVDDPSTRYATAPGGFAHILSQRVMDAFLDTGTRHSRKYV
ncbi:hypothetical protein, partial [Methylobacter luteus]|uniref:hypothetical protein n=1 Tax=Methylobacter luteus TaxID=415 RepID=UPI001E50622F